MKRLLGLFLALSLLLSACASAPATTPTAETGDALLPTSPVLEEQNGKAAKGFGLPYVPEYGFNPYSCVCVTNRPVLSLVYEGLFVLGSGFQPEPVLCDRFAVSGNGKNYLLTLCDGVTFSDGSPLTARDVVASLNAAKDSEYYGSRFYKVAEFTEKDEKTVAISLYTAYENLPLLLDVPIVKAGTERDERPLGTGPYVFDEAGEGKLLLRRSGSWWQDRLPPVSESRITLTAAANPTEIRDSFEFGDASLVCADLNSPAAVGYRCDYELWDCPTAIMVYLGFNLGSEIFRHKALRAAVTHVIDRESLVTGVYKGFAEAACLPCSPSSPLYDKSLAQNYGLDTAAFADERNQVTVAEGYVGSILVCTSDPAQVDLAHRLSAVLSEYDLKLEVRAVDYKTYANRLATGLYDMYLAEARLSGNFDLSQFFRRYGSLCYGGIQSNAMEQLCTAALENSGNAYDLQKAVMENGYFCPILFKSYAVMANRGVITTLQPAVDNVFHLPGGRSLADASVPYDDLTGSAVTEPTDTPPETEADG